ncbi:hypothetical protein VTN00DRAFT_8476 [Thermoascus crustaceus]|uniref:uncharacterized protein n=1 Tax=Thermoascus crustaceus TaxID=5088 RepID=UPI0037441CAE
MAFSALLHWLVSLSVFYVRIIQYDQSGLVDEANMISTCGVSPIGMIFTISFGDLAFVILVGLGFRRFPTRMPLAANCSFAISAACHPPLGDEDGALKPVMWEEVLPYPPSYNHKEEGEEEEARSASHGHEDIVKSLLEKGADINFISERHVTAITAAASYGHKDIVNMLLDSGADPNSMGAHLNALIAAALKGHKDIVKILLESGAYVNCTTGYSTALTAAVAKGHKDIVNMLLHSGADVNILLDYGAYVNIRGEYADTALAAAALKGHKDVVNTLIRSGADPNIFNNSNGTTALIQAASHGYEEIVTILLKASHGYKNIVKGVDTISEYEDALTKSVTHGHEDVVRILLDTGADPNIVGRDVHSRALFMALAYQSRYIDLLKTKRLVALLLAAGARVDEVSAPYLERTQKLADEIGPDFAAYLNSNHK